MKLISLLTCLALVCTTGAQEWSTQPEYPGVGRDDAVAFSIKGSGYVVTGNHGGFSESNKMYRFDTNFSTWEEVAAFPGVARQYSSVFTIQNCAYLIGGIAENSDVLKDVWKFDANQNQWEQLNDFPDSARWSAVAFSIGEKGYFGTGTTHFTKLKDFWKYLPQTDTWIRINNLPGLGRREAIGASVQNTALVGLGLNSFTPSGYLSDVYQLNPVNDTWESVPNPYSLSRSYSAAIGYQGKIYLGSGMDENGTFHNDFWEFNPRTQFFTQINNIPSDSVRGCSVFSSLNGIYWATGLTDNFTRSKEMYRFSIPISDVYCFEVISNPSVNTIQLKWIKVKEQVEVKIVNLQGDVIYNESSSQEFINLTSIPAGVYVVQLDFLDGEVQSKKVVVL